MTGLGITTVSKALRDAPDIKDTTKARVRLIADQIGYKPDRAGQSLRTGKSHVICLMLPAQEGISNLMTDFVVGVSDALRTHLIKLY